MKLCHVCLSKGTGCKDCYCLRSFVHLSNLFKEEHIQTPKDLDFQAKNNGAITSCAIKTDPTPLVGTNPSHSCGVLAASGAMQRKKKRLQVVAVHTKLGFA